MNSATKRTSWGNRARRGISLVEVLIVLVLLVVGIISIARLFPGGFYSIGVANDYTAADRLAQEQLETLKQNDQFLMDSVAMYTADPNFAYSGGLAATADSSNSGLKAGILAGTDDINQHYTLPDGYVPSAEGSFDDINKFRAIQKERLLVPSQAAGGQSPNVSVAVLRYGPVIPNTLTLTTTPWAAKNGNSQPSPSNPNDPLHDPNDLIVPGQPNFAVDLTAGYIALPQAAYKQDFVATIGTASGAQTIPVTVPANTATQWMTISNAPAGPWTYIELRRVLSEATFGNLNALSADPYSYAYANDGDRMMGIVQFNTQIAGQTLEASYVVKDWHIIRESQEVPQASQGATIRLALHHIRTIGSALFNGRQYRGIFPLNSQTDPNAYGSTAYSKSSIIIVDTDTGDSVGLNDTTSYNSDDPKSNPNTALFRVSYEGGRITFPSDANSPWESSKHHHVRVYYQTDKDWGVAIQKNPSVYTENSGGTAPFNQGNNPLNGQIYAIQPGQYTLTGGQIYFPITDAGMSVELDNVSYTDTNGQTRTVGSLTVAVSDAATSALPDINNSGIRRAVGVSGGSLASLLPNCNAQYPITIGAVRGRSARVIVVWREQEKWRTRTLDTVLTPGQ